MTAAGRDERGSFAVAGAWLRVDDRRTYHVRELGCTIFAGGKEA